MADDSGRESSATLFFATPSVAATRPAPTRRERRAPDLDCFPSGQLSPTWASADRLAEPALWRIIDAMTTDADQRFLRQAEDCMSDLLRRLDDLDPDELEADTAAGVIKMHFADGSVCVLNRQSAAHQLWLAEGATAWHFAQDGSGQWLDTKGRGPIEAVLAQLLSRKIGRDIDF